MKLISFIFEREIDLLVVNEKRQERRPVSKQNNSLFGFLWVEEGRKEANFFSKDLGGGGLQKCTSLTERCMTWHTVHLSKYKVPLWVKEGRCALICTYVKSGSKCTQSGMWEQEEYSMLIAWRHSAKFPIFCGNQDPLGSLRFRAYLRPPDTWELWTAGITPIQLYNIVCKSCTTI